MQLLAQHLKAWRSDERLPVALGQTVQGECVPASYLRDGKRIWWQQAVFVLIDGSVLVFTQSKNDRLSDADKALFQALARQLHSSRPSVRDPEFKRELQTKYLGAVEHVQPMKNGNFRGSSPKGLTWHHGDSTGSLQLADFNDHKSYHKIYHPDGTGRRNK